MEFLAFAAFAVLVVAWLVAPTKAVAVESTAEARAAA